MEQTQTKRKLQQYLWLSMFISVVLPMSLGLALASYVPDWRWLNYPFHSMVETVGSVSAVTISVLMILMVKNRHLARHYIWVAAALLGMGILDGFHAVLHAGTSFVWLHSVATLSGGLAFAAVWLPKRLLSKNFQVRLITSVIFFSLGLGIFSITFPQYLPVMVENMEFSPVARILNITGGLGFLTGTLYFVQHYKRVAKKPARQDLYQQDMIFANHCLLFGIAGLLFETSAIWDAGWWWWHILRLAAYIIVLVYFFSLFKQEQDLLSENEQKMANINKELESRVIARTAELEKASQAKSNFLSSMSHELRTPMNAILGFAQIMKMDSDINAEQKDSVDEIIIAGKHLMDLINEILDMAKIEENKLDIKIRNINIADIMLESIALLQEVANQASITIINNIDLSQQYPVYADRLRLKQACINLLSNAIKYNSEKGTVTIDIDVIGNKTTRISVTDTGNGISPEKLKKLFIPFERLGNEGKLIEGAGIGLALSKRLMVLMGGTIGVNSEQGKGSTFYIELPCTE